MLRTLKNGYAGTPRSDGTSHRKGRSKGPSNAHRDGLLVPRSDAGREWPHASSERYGAAAATIAHAVPAAGLPAAGLPAAAERAQGP